jgi:hypothetical protein
MHFAALAQMRGEGDGRGLADDGLQSRAMIASQVQINDAIAKHFGQPWSIRFWLVPATQSKPMKGNARATRRLER